VREHDLIILSKEPIDLRGSGDIKRIATPEFLKRLVFKFDAMIGIVTKKSLGNGKGMGAHALIKVDISKASFFDHGQLMREQET
jgi:hypothetical protein